MHWVMGPQFCYELCILLCIVLATPREVFLRWVAIHSRQQSKGKSRFPISSDLFLLGPMFCWFDVMLSI